MKKYFGFILFVLTLSCDKIDSPLPEEYGKFDWSLYPLDPTTYPYVLLTLLVIGGKTLTQKEYYLKTIQDISALTALLPLAMLKT